MAPTEEKELAPARAFVPIRCPCRDLPVWWLLQDQLAILCHIEPGHSQTTAFPLGPRVSEYVHNSPLCLLQPHWFSKPGIGEACNRLMSPKLGVPDVGCLREACVSSVSKDGLMVKPRLSLAYPPQGWPFSHLPCEGAVPLVFRSLSEEMVPYVAADLGGHWEELSPRSSCVGILDCPPVSNSYPYLCFFFFNLQIYNNVGSPALTLNQISLMFHHLGYYLLAFANQSSV